MNKLKVGDKVVIRDDSKFYGTRIDNPNNNIKGKIIYIEDFVEYCYFVEWDNGAENEYTKNDLELVNQKYNISLLQELTKQALFNKFASGFSIGGYDLEFDDEGITIGCQRITKKNAVKIAKAILEVY